MSARKYIPKQDRSLYIRFEAKRVCKDCDKGDRCEESTHRKRVVDRWICKICSEKHINRAGVIRHMQEEHERPPRTHTKSAPQIPCNQCGKKFLTMHQYYDHRNSEHVQPGGSEGPKRRQTKHDQEPDLKRAKKVINAEFEDLLVKIKAQLQSKD